MPKETIREKIVERLDAVELLMKKQTHLVDDVRVLEALDGVEKFWKALSEDEKDFIGAVRFAVRTKYRWD